MICRGIIFALFPVINTKNKTMPWTKSDYPNSMKNLPAKVRGKAIEIANALLRKKSMDEGIVIATATSRAKDWVANHRIRSASKAKHPKTTK